MNAQQSTDAQGCMNPETVNLIRFTPKLQLLLFIVR